MNEKPQGVRLQKYFTDCGILSRRAAEAEIVAGNVTVNGNTAELGMRVFPGADTILWKGVKVLPQGTDGRTYIMLNKPIGYVTTLSDDKGRKTVADLLSGVPGRVYPIGRLDMYSDGLLLCTDDGDLANRMMHPSHNVAKRYTVTVKGTITEGDIAALTEPMELDGYLLHPIEAKILKTNIERKDGTLASAVEITLYEGRNRQIRRMCEAVGLKVLALRRLAVGTLTLGNLPAGKWRHLTNEEIEYLKSF